VGEWWLVRSPVVEGLNLNIHLERPQLVRSLTHAMFIIAHTNVTSFPIFIPCHHHRQISICSLRASAMVLLVCTLPFFHGFVRHPSVITRGDTLHVGCFHAYHDFLPSHCPLYIPGLYTNYVWWFLLAFLHPVWQKIHIPNFVPSFTFWSRG